MAAGKLAAKKLGGLAAKSKGFTLAEVLITLAIIGVVAALTIPVVVAKYQQKQYYTQFMKMYNTLSNAFSMATNDYGSYSTWGLASGDGDNPENIKKVADILKEYIKTGEAPTSYDGVSGLKVLGSTTEMAEYSDLLNWGSYFFLPDGSMVIVSYASQSEAIIYFDTNGIKEPNMTGRDFFDIRYKKDQYNSNDKYMLVSPNDNLSHCDPSNAEDEEGGMSCVYRLLTEGKMDY